MLFLWLLHNKNIVFTANVGISVNSTKKPSLQIVCIYCRNDKMKSK